MYVYFRGENSKLWSPMLKLRLDVLLINREEIALKLNLINLMREIHTRIFTQRVIVSLIKVLFY